MFFNTKKSLNHDFYDKGPFIYPNEIRLLELCE